VSIDETTDVEGHFIANVTIGTLEIEHSGSMFLLHSEQLEKNQFFLPLVEFSTNL